MLFVGGIHGAGKTYFSARIAKKYKMLHYSASELIARRKNKQFAKGKRVEGINKNQDYLIEAINNLAVEHKHILLDGYFCLLNKEGNITKIPEQTFKRLAPNGIIVLTDTVESIFSRLYKRDSIKHDMVLLELFQNRELNHSKQISKKLGIPYLVYNNNEDLDSVTQFIDRIVNTKYCEDLHLS